MHTVIGLIVNAVCFGILFPVLIRLISRKWIGWRATLTAVAVYLVVGFLIDWSGILDRLWA
jgi:hypothetical protein